MDVCLTICVLWLLACILPGIFESIAQSRAEKKDEKFLRDNPQAWAAKEQIKLDQQRLAAGIDLANKENSRKNVDTGFSLGRAMGWW